MNDTVSQDLVDKFVAHWSQSSGAERANFQSFANALCELIGVPLPDPKREEPAVNSYTFEYDVKFKDADGAESPGRIDLYKKGCFVLEAKQSRLEGRPKAVPGQKDLFVTDTQPQGRRSANRAWDVLMMNARRQAEEYAKALPPSHGWPPFILVCDVGHCVEVYADFSGQGKNYAQFPDRQGFRIYLEDLRKQEIRAQLKAIWRDPHALDPARRSAKVTRDIAARLAQVSKALEAKGHDAEQVALFLMRCLFTMFAEDVELLPKESFTALLAKCADDPTKFAPMVEQLWVAMDKGDFAYAIERKVPKFNGRLFANAAAIPLGKEEIGELLAAAKADWRSVEPAIFGTLLEQALDREERKRLGAHYTPRAYVERLVVATIMEPLRAEWGQVQATAERLKDEKRPKEALAVVKKFHDRLCETRVLDPACGTGNFLYVSMELMKRLEGELLESLLDLGGQEALSSLERHTVDPHQFLGLEINPRAAAIAELVIWLGYLQWHFRTRGGPPSEPILRDFRTIEVKDAVLTWDGYPLTTVVDGKETYPNARRPDWPMAEFIVGNPPFVPNREFRTQFRDAYVEALKQAFPEFNKAADFVLFFWIQALRQRQAQRVGLISTSRLRMPQNNAIFADCLSDEWHIIFAIPDHEWPSAKDNAAVRVCFITVDRSLPAGGAKLILAPDHDKVAGRSSPNGAYASVRTEYIPPTLDSSFDRRAITRLLANWSMTHAGVKPYSRFLHIDSMTRTVLFGEDQSAAKHAPRIYNGVDIGQRARNLYVLDLHGLSEDQVRHKFPKVFQYLLEKVKPERAEERNQRLRAEYWLFEANREEMREGLRGLDRYLVTLENSPQRYFTFLPIAILPDQKLRVIVSADVFIFSVLSSRAHEVFSRRVGGRAGKANTPVYNTDCFACFPFPNCSEELKQRIRVVGEEIDEHRKARQAEHPNLMLTQMYNVLEKLKVGESLSEAEERIKDEGLVLILNDLHEQLDQLVFQAYGWPDDLSDEEILERLVALNKERATEEKTGKVRWLRPDYQIPRFGSDAEKARLQAEKEKARAAQVTLVLEEEPEEGKPRYPTDDELAETAAVMSMLATSPRPITIDDIAANFAQGKQIKKRVALTILALARLGHLASPDGGQSFSLQRGV